MAKGRLLLALLAALGPLSALADGYVVGHSTVNVGPEEVREIFLGNMQFAGPLRLVPVDNGAVQGEFLYKVLHMDPDRYAAIWNRKSFREAINPPQVLLSDADVMDFVRRTPGAIGYVGTDPGRANVILKY